MDVQVGDILEMKKPHPCGSRRFLVLRSGMDLKKNMRNAIKSFTTLRLCPTRKRMRR